MQYAVIMAGGSGQRLWPLSRKNRPKQIMDTFDGNSLLRLCVDRISGIFDADHILVVTNQEYADIVRQHLPELPPENILGEPVGRDTAGAIGLAATVLKQKDPDSIMAVFSADQIIEPIAPLHKAVEKAFRFLKTNPKAMFTFGIRAAFAHTGFGYLKRGEKVEATDDIYPVEAFKEKPNKSTAGKYIRSGKYCWNSGMFVWRVDTILSQLEHFLPENARLLEQIGSAWNTDKAMQALNEHFTDLRKISIDFGVMEHAADVYMCELDCHWVDVGSYQSLAETIGKADQDNNITTADTQCLWIDSGNNVAISDKKDHLIVAIHVEDMIVVHTEDATLICHRDETDHLKTLLQQMEAKGLEQFE